MPETLNSGRDSETFTITLTLDSRQVYGVVEGRQQVTVQRREKREF